MIRHKRWSTTPVLKNLVFLLNYKENFKLSLSNKCVVHWDSKLVKDFLEKGDRLAVLVSDYSGAAEGKILEIPVIKSSSGVEQANAVIQALRMWDLEEHVIGQCFDTTTSNTGHENGAAVIDGRKSYFS